MLPRTSNFNGSCQNEALLFQCQCPLLFLFVYHFLSQSCETFIITIKRNLAVQNWSGVCATMRLLNGAFRKPFLRFSVDRKHFENYVVTIITDFPERVFHKRKSQITGDCLRTFTLIVSAHPFTAHANSHATSCMSACEINK